MYVFWNFIKHLKSVFLCEIGKEFELNILKWKYIRVMKLLRNIKKFPENIAKVHTISKETRYILFKLITLFIRYVFIQYMHANWLFIDVQPVTAVGFHPNFIQSYRSFF